jgi:tetratricopeptide (TPR) repeat protein
MIASSRAMLEELGITQRILETDVSAGLIELLDGDPVEAERYLRAAYDGLRGHGLAIDAAQAAALLGRALLAQGRQDEAEQLSHESEALAGDDLKAAIAWRGVRAEALARRGEHAPALDLARAAVDVAAATDALLDHADARLALATTLRAAGREEEASVEEKRAIELWEAKDSTLPAVRARRDRQPTGLSFSPPEKGVAEEPASTQPIRRRVRANSASAFWARFEAVMRNRDLAALTTLATDDVQVLHHPTAATWGREEALNRFKLLFRAKGPVISMEALATLGDFLLLGRDVTSFTSFVDNQLDVGEMRSSYINLLEFDDRGRISRDEVFADNRLADAIRRLYERHAEILPDGPERASAAATARSVAAVLGPFELERYAAGIAPTVEFYDHRKVGFPSGRGIGELFRSIGTLLEMADDVTTRVDDILALGPDGFLVRWTTFGTHRLSRGPFEWQFLRLCVFGADGLLARAEQFDADDAERALARFDQLVASASEPTASGPTARFASAGSRFFDRFNERWQARDWEGIVFTYTPETRLIDRRSLTGLDLQGSDFIASLRVVFDLPASRWQGQVLATRGESLALGRWRVESADDTAGLSEVEYLGLVEVDASGRGFLSIVFDLDALDAAYAELDDRYAAGEAAPFAPVVTALRAFAAAVTARDWDALEAVFVPALVVYDHRPLGWETLHGPATLVATFKSLVELAPDVRLRIDHVTVSAKASLAMVTFVGMHEGGAFEDARVVVHEFNREGKICRHDIYDVEHLGEAKSRFDRIVAKPE